MIVFDFEQSAETSVLKLSGKLLETDAGELKRLLRNSLTGIIRMEINLDNVSDVSIPCLEVFRSIIDEVENIGKNLMFTGTETVSFGSEELSVTAREILKG